MSNSWDIRAWAELGKTSGHAYMIVCVPKDSDKADVVFAQADTVCDQVKELGRKALEVYDLNIDLNEQITAKRAWNLPEQPAV